MMDAKAMGGQLSLPVTPLMVGKGSVETSGITMNVFLMSDDIMQAAEAMLKQAYHLENIDALDVAEGFLITYHYAHFTKPGRIAHRVLVCRDEAELPSISSIFQGADWHERECHDFHGVKFAGHPNLLPLLLDPETPNGVLLKDDKGRKPLREILNPGKIVFKGEGFTLFDEEQPDEAAPEE
ncbi:NADH-quinone oxidoreductase subunit C [Desulfovibrio sp. JC010]|uniref:NADH-quinone oxidoreductase subunit C n=1 Tax=Desulfovibrio sp. JC010 TaxID=2593641 RepID=UPI001EF16B21|nr:NADH-quinone oxidoreductase subunit C [Desulfovibrio sp. JC010]